MKSCRNFFVLAVFLLLTFLVGTKTINADIVYIQFTSSDTINGNIDGNTFTGVNWSMEFAVETSTADSNLDSGIGLFDSAIVSSIIEIDSIQYEVNVSAFALNQIQLSTSNIANLDLILANTGSGTIYAGGAFQDFFPTVFTDVNDLGSNANASANNNTRLGLGDGGQIQFLDLETSAGEMIDISLMQFSDGNTQVASATTSMFSLAVPEPGTTSLGIFATMWLTAFYRKRRKRFNPS